MRCKSPVTRRFVVRIRGSRHYPEPERHRIPCGRDLRGFTIRSGSGIARNNGQQYNRWHVDLSGSLHLPLTKRWAVAGRITGNTIISEPADSLRPAELYRVGGYSPCAAIRTTNSRFKTVAYGQTECLFYFSPEGSIYPFADAGVGFGAQDNLTNVRRNQAFRLRSGHSHSVKTRQRRH